MGALPVEGGDSGRRVIGAERRIATGSAHTCFVAADASVQCWGWNGFGQLGDGSFADRAAPTPIDNENVFEQITSVVAGAVHTCALVATNVYCWGDNSAGQVDGNPSAAEKEPSLALVTGPFRGLALGIDHSCGLLLAGGVRCWGANNLGQLGIGNTDPQPNIPPLVSNLSDAVAISAGLFHTCAVRVNGRVVCWGDNEFGQATGTPTATLTLPTEVANVDQAVDVAAGYSHTCALRSNGTVRCWGNNAEGELGNDTFKPTPTAVAVFNLTTAKALSAGWFHTCAVLADASTVCWGDNSSGQIGDATFTNRPRPTPVVNLAADAVTVSAGNVHTCVQRANGSLRCWGFNDLGQLGGGTIGTAPTTPIDPGIRGSDLAGDVDTGADHSCAVRTRGTVACWGLNASGQLSGSTSPATTFNPVGLSTKSLGTSNVVSVVAGGSHSCALHVAGTVTCWGSDSRGQIGLGSISGIVRAPVAAVTNLSGVIAISAGLDFTCALRVGGDVRCWGAGDAGQLGNTNNGTSDSAAPVAVSNLANVVAISAGDRHACAIRSDGTARCWGANSEGQLGNNTTSTGATIGHVGVGSPTALSDARGIAAGALHSCAVRANGTVACWGRNTEGQLGTGDANSSLVPRPLVNVVTSPDGQPVFVVTITPRELAAGGAHTCATFAFMTLCWGRSADGESGTPNATALAPVGVPSTVFAPSGERPMTIAAGGAHSCAIPTSGAVRCWGNGASGQNGNTSDQTQQFTVSSFTVNIVPEVQMTSARGVIEIIVVANCAAGNHVDVSMVVTQGGVSSSGHAAGQCQGRLAEYRVTVATHGRDRFVAGTALAAATAVITDNSTIIETQEWTREIVIQP